MFLLELLASVKTEFWLFGATLVGVIFFPEKHLRVAFAGLASIVVYTALFTEKNLISHSLHEAPLILNLLGLLVGFGLMADHFQKSKLALKAPAILPDDWKGPFVLLCLIFMMSIILDNIAAAVIGTSIALVVFDGKVRVGYLAGIVAASNAGGAGSVIGDTTTTMMWIDGVSPWDVSHAFLPSVIMLVVAGIPLSIAQQRYQPIIKDEIPSHGSDNANVDYSRVGIVLAMLIGVVAGNILFEMPAVGLWVALLLTALFVHKPEWSHVPSEISNASFLLALVLAASLMPVEQLPAASPTSTMALGYISRVFDNIPLTKLGLDQGGFDWGWLAYSVGVGGSMTWFGSSAGVAVAKKHLEFKKMKTFVKEAWILDVAYLTGFAALYIVFGWQPHAPHN